jgi:hypothetical protein
LSGGHCRFAFGRDRGDEAFSDHNTSQQFGVLERQTPDDGTAVGVADEMHPADIQRADKRRDVFPQFTTAAIIAAADPSSRCDGSEALQPHAVSKLYYIAWTKSTWAAYQAAFRTLVSTEYQDE